MAVKVKSRIILILLLSIIVGAEEWRSVPVNFAVSHKLSVGESIAKGKKVSSNLVFNLFTGRIDSVNGAVFGTILNQTTEGFNGAQMSSVCNINGSNTKGAQLSGVCNVTKGAVEGVQNSGVTNVSGDFLGAQHAGINNVVHGKMHGVQMAGISNIVSGHVTGVQAAGISSISEEIKGVQLSAVHNHTGDLEGAQIAGVVSSAGNIKGLQLSGVCNVAKEVTGVQIGLINVAEKNEGAAIGLISIVKDYAPGFMAWTDEQLFINAGIRTGTRKLYNLLFVGVRPDESPYMTLGAGIGTRIPFTERFSVNIDATAQNIIQQKETDSNHFINHFQGRLRLFADVNIAGKFAVFAGPTFTTTVSEGNRTMDILKDNSLSRIKRRNNTEVQSLGCIVGFRIN